MKQIVVFLIAFSSRSLAQDCQQFIISEYYAKPVNAELVKRAAADHAPPVMISDLYQVIANADKTKFIAFFAGEKVQPGSGNAPAGINHAPGAGYESYTLIGLSLSGKWYVERSGSQGITGNNIDSLKSACFSETLVNKSFINCNSKKENKDFWDRDAFAKIKREKRWSAAEALVNTPYIGLPLIVAGYRKDSLNSGRLAEDAMIYQAYIAPALDKLKAAGQYDEAATAQQGRDFVLIYPPSKNIMLYPVTFKKGNERLIKFYALEKKGNAYESYEWTYLKPAKDATVLSVMNTLTPWAYELPYVSDAAFWNTYVTIRSGDRYQYLVKVQP